MKYVITPSGELALLVVLVILVYLVPLCWVVTVINVHTFQVRSKETAALVWSFSGLLHALYISTKLKTLPCPPNPKPAP